MLTRACFSCPPCRGADKEAKNQDGKTALEVAELNSDESDLTDVIKLLKEAK